VKAGATVFGFDSAESLDSCRFFISKIQRFVNHQMGVSVTKCDHCEISCQVEKNGAKLECGHF